MSSGDETESEADAVKRKRNATARGARDRKKLTEAARRAKLSRFREQIEQDAEEDEFWSGHEISNDDFKPLSGAVCLYNAAILVMHGHLERKQVAIICEVPIDAI